MKKLITLLGALTITSSIAPLTIACGNKVKESKEESFDTEKITAEEILNFQNEYKGLNDNGEIVTVKPDKLGSLNNSYIEVILKENLSSIFMRKLTGLDKTKLQDTNYMQSPPVSRKINEFITLSIFLLSINVKSELNSKKFVATIEKNDRDKFFKDKESMEQAVEKYCNFTEAEKKNTKS